MINAVDLLSFDLPLFDGIDASALPEIGRAAQVKRIEAWEILFNQHDQSCDVFFLLSGSLLAVYWTGQGREIIFTRFPVGAHFGELAALDDGQRSLAVLARETSEVLVLPQQGFLTLFNEVPDIRQRVTRGLVKRVRDLTDKNLELTTFSVEQRVASYLLRTAVERDCLTTGGVIDAAPTHAEIAASIGANREMVSRTFTKLSAKGAIRSTRQRVEICDPEQLSELLDP